MTPEERMKRLKDFDRWTVTSVPPRESAVRARRLPAFVIPMIAGVATVALAAIVIVGAVNLREYRALHPAGTATPTTSAPSPTATDPVITSTGVDAPAQPLGGSCDNLATLAQLTDATGVPISVPESEADADGLISTTVNATWMFAKRQAGALSCSWSSSDQNLQYRISVTVFPAIALAPRADETCGEVISNDGYSGENDCVVSRLSNGTQLLGSVHSPSLAESKDLSTDLIALFDSATDDAEPVAAATPDSSVWALGNDCAADQPATVDGVEWTFSQAEIGYGGGPDEVFQELVGSTTKDTLYCVADLPDRRADDADTPVIQYAVYGGGAWVFDEYTRNGASALDVPGFDHAAVVGADDEGAQGFLLLVRGKNLLSVSLFDTDPARTFAVSEAFADALDEQ